jgi:hypothetical protein
MKKLKRACDVHHQGKRQKLSHAKILQSAIKGIIILKENIS